MIRDKLITETTNVPSHKIASVWFKSEIKTPKTC